MSVFDVEYAAPFGALDSAIADDGRPMSAYLLRELGRNYNGLLREGDPIVNMVWDSSTDAADGSVIGSLQAVGYPFGWRPLIWRPVFAPKKPTHRKGTCRIIGKVDTAGQKVHVQVVTSAEPFNPSPDLSSAANVLSFSDDSFETVTSGTLSLGPGDMESVQFFLYADANDVTPGGGFGTNAGTLETMGASIFIDTSASFTASPANSRYDSGGTFYVVFRESSSGPPLAAPRLITEVVDSTTIRFEPPLSPEEQNMAVDARYEIYEAARFRVCNIHLTEDDLAL